MTVRDHTQCTNEPFIGYAPISYFILGLIEMSCSAFLAVIIAKRNFLPQFNSTTNMNFLLPVYLTVVMFLVFLCLVIGFDRIIGIYPTNIWITLVKWFILRSCTEGQSIFFRHSGIGFQSVRSSILLGALWSACNVVVLGLAYVIFGFEVFVILSIVIAAIIASYYIILWRAPADKFHRRPAARQFAKLNFVLLSVQIVIIIAYLSSLRRADATCALELVFSTTEFCQLGIMLYGFLLDSMFWQGLYSDESTNLNVPMMGMWDMNDQDTVRMVTESIVQLERKVVYIIPFSHLKVDTSKYFSGGSARVYRGLYQGYEVAIKFLFCMELTPDRVIEFCSEATMLNSLQHENIVTCYGVAIMPPAISLVTEFCTYGSLFDFLHSFDWMVTENRMSDSLAPDSSVNDAASVSESVFSANSSAHGGGGGGGTDRELQTQNQRNQQKQPLSDGMLQQLQQQQLHQDSQPSPEQQQQQQQTQTPPASPSQHGKRLSGTKLSAIPVAGGVMNTNQPLTPIQQLLLRHASSQQPYPLSLQPVGSNSFKDYSMNSSSNSMSYNHADIERGIMANHSNHGQYTGAGTGAGTGVQVQVAASQTPSVRGSEASQQTTTSSVGYDMATRLANAVGGAGGGQGGGGGGGGGGAGGVTTTTTANERPFQQQHISPMRVESVAGQSDAGGSGTNRTSSSAADQAGKERSRSWSNAIRNRISSGSNRSDAQQHPERHSMQLHKRSGAATGTRSEKMQSATSILLTRELGYGLGPSSASNSNRAHNSINYTKKSMSALAGTSQSIPSVLLSMLSSSIHSLGHVLPGAIKLRMARECCAGVAYLHSKKIMHCDIKTLNFLVTSSLHIKLADLGEARAFYDPNPRKLPRNINWSSPEILMDKPTSEIGPGADIWSLAMVIAEIINGEVPYDTIECRQMSLEKFVDYVREGVRPSILHHQEFLRATWLHEMLDKAWSFDAADRCSASEMLRIFDTHIGSTVPL